MVKTDWTKDVDVQGIDFLDWCRHQLEGKDLTADN